jgi:site-specific DNA-methyltransferase (adenine-specific)
MAPTSFLTVEFSLSRWCESKHQRSNKEHTMKNYTSIDRKRDQTPDNCILNGDCTELLKTLGNETIDLVVTDPPYLVGYKDRSGRRIANDGRCEGVLGAFNEVYRVLTPNAFCISFYGWNRVDAFFRAWKGAGFTPVGHIVWQKNYASKTGFLKSCHEQAYLLAKGTPEKPRFPLSDVRPWEYTGNRSHPTEKAVSILKPLIETFSQPGDIVLDPFAGSGSTLVAAVLSGRRYLGMELEAAYCQLAQKRLAGAASFLQREAA